MGRLKYPELRTMYKIDRKIGEGGFAKVRLATHLLTGEKVAIKIMEKAALGRDLRRVLSEVEALKTLTHQYIAQVYQIIDSDEHIFIIMEYCSGGELFDYIVNQKRLTETEARGFFRQILSAVAFLHKKGYAHRDLKPENILLDSDHNLKLIDFGLCAKPNGGISMCLKTACGSLNYAAPELLLGVRYLGPQADVWSLGVLLYALLCGALPFDESQGMAGELQRKIITGTYDEPEHLSQLSREMIRGMLQKDPRLRLTTDQLLSHKWITLECYDPVCYRPIHEHHERDDLVLKALSDYYNTSVDGVWQRLSSWNYDYFTACYLLLLNKKRKGLRFTLGGPCTPVKVRTKLRERQLQHLPETKDQLSAIKSPLSPSHPSYSKMVEHMQDRENREMDRNLLERSNKMEALRFMLKAVVDEFLRRQESPNPRDYHLFVLEVLKSLKTHEYEEIMQKVLVDPFSRDEIGGSPSPSLISGVISASTKPKLRGGSRSPSVSISSASGTNVDQQRTSLESPSVNDYNLRDIVDSLGIVTRSRTRKRGHDSSLDFINLPRTSTPLATTPVTKRRRISGMGSENKTSPSTPGKFLHSVERKLNRMKNILTPKKADHSTPATLNAKDLHDVSVTSMNDPKQVLDSLTGALSRCNIQCKPRGYLIRGKVFEEKIADKKSPNCKLIFELEVCWIKSEQRAPLVGIRRRRLKGDTFYYKKVCEQILQLTVK